jgi:hypothetical protein
MYVFKRAVRLYGNAISFYCHCRKQGEWEIAQGTAPQTIKDPSVAAFEVAGMQTVATLVISEGIWLVTFAGEWLSTIEWDDAMAWSIMTAGFVMI